MFWNFNLDPISLTKVNLKSGSIFVSLDKKNSGRRGETKREPDTNLLWNVYDPLFLYIYRNSQSELLLFRNTRELSRVLYGRERAVKSHFIDRD